MGSPPCNSAINDEPAGDDPAVVFPVATGPFHRIREVREQQAVTIRTISRRTGLSMRQLREEEKPSSDLPVSVLMRWQAALEVPLAELLVEPDMRLSQSIAHRAKLVKLMKTTLSLCENVTDARTKRLSQMLHEQVLDLMPELSEVSSWPNIGSRRGSEEIGRIGQHPISLDGMSMDSVYD